jgi:hypothetical protein
MARASLRRSRHAAAAVTGTGRLVYSPTLVRVAAGIYLLFALWWLLALLTGPNPGHTLAVAPGLLAAGMLVYVLFWRPAVLVDDHGVELRNVLRDVRVPWSALESVDTRFALTLLVDGGRHQSWAASAPGRPSMSLAERWPAGRDRSDPAGRADHALPDPRWSPDGIAAQRSSSDLRADSGAAAFMVQQRWNAWRESPAGRAHDRDEGEAQPVRVTWNLVAPMVIAAGVLLSWLSVAAGL